MLLYFVNCKNDTYSYVLATGLVCNSIQPKSRAFCKSITKYGNTAIDRVCGEYCIIITLNTIICVVKMYVAAYT